MQVNFIILLFFCMIGLLHFQILLFTMTILLSNNIFISTFTLLFLLSSSATDDNYTFPPTNFINCGSDSSIKVGATTFTGDRNTFSGQSTTIRNPTSNLSSPIYETARIFTQKTLSCYYEFKTEGTGHRLYMVRLHFYPFSSSQDNYDLFNARFDVLATASGYLLLSNFSIPRNETVFPVINEFLLPVNGGSKLKIYFRPSQDSSFAFVNAIEAFITPQGFIPEPSHHIRTNNSVSSSALTVIHRISVGGSAVTSERDTMRRSWFPDDPFLVLQDSAMNISYEGILNYEPGLATSNDAPDLVYKTAKHMANTTKNSSITWLFDSIKKDATFFVRFHFCDIVSVSRNQTVFDLYIYGIFGKVVSPWDTIPISAAPFYIDFVVGSDASGVMNISVDPRSDSQLSDAFLNGVEIMELINNKEPVPDATEPTNNRLWKILGSAIGGVVFLFVSALVIFFFWRKSRKGKSVENGDSGMVNVYRGSDQSKTTTERTPVGSTNPDMNLGLKIPLVEIFHATNGFDHNCMIGEGGFGKVYKGALRNGDKVAVKRSEPGHGQGLTEFQTEIMILSRIRHHHLVSLIGYCDEQNEMILVYEFMDNGTLREHLYKSNEDIGESSARSELSWDQRLEICIGAANGLHYLHTGLKGPIIHRDIKSTNILLDEHFVGKVADFGLSKDGLLDETHVSTDVKGSFGYLDPEYLMCMQLTQKSDVYSFGVVLLEVLCARPAVNNMLPRAQVNLAEWGLSWQKENQLEKIIDPLLAGKINPNSLRKFGETVEKCLQDSGADRPSMVDVLWDLKYARELQQPATMPQEFHEDSTTDVSWALPGINRLPSINLTTTSCVSESEVFSQLMIDEAR